MTLSKRFKATRYRFVDRQGQPLSNWADLDFEPVSGTVALSKNFSRRSIAAMGLYARQKPDAKGAAGEEIRYSLDIDDEPLISLQACYLDQQACQFSYTGGEEISKCPIGLWLTAGHWIPDLSTSFLKKNM